MIDLQIRDPQQLPGKFYSCVFQKKETFGFFMTWEAESTRLTVSTRVRKEIPRNEDAGSFSKYLSPLMLRWNTISMLIIKLLEVTKSKQGHKNRAFIHHTSSQLRQRFSPTAQFLPVGIQFNTSRRYQITEDALSYSIANLSISFIYHIEIADMESYNIYF